MKECIRTAKQIYRNSLKERMEPPDPNNGVLAQKLRRAQRIYGQLQRANRRGQGEVEDEDPDDEDQDDDEGDEEQDSGEEGDEEED